MGRPSSGWLRPNFSTAASPVVSSTKKLVAAQKSCFTWRLRRIGRPPTVTRSGGPSRPRAYMKPQTRGGAAPAASGAGEGDLGGVGRRTVMWPRGRSYPIKGKHAAQFRARGATGRTHSDAGDPYPNDGTTGASRRL